MADPLIAKRGKLVVQTAKGLKPATRKDLDGASLVGARGAIFVETDKGLEPATIRDARSAVGRVARQLVKNPATPFADDPALASRAGRKARAGETADVRRERGVAAGTAAAARLTSAERTARAKKSWETRRKRLSKDPQ